MVTDEINFSMDKKKRLSISLNDKEQLKPFKRYLNRNQQSIQSYCNRYHTQRGNRHKDQSERKRTNFNKYTENKESRDKCYSEWVLYW